MTDSWQERSASTADEGLPIEDGLPPAVSVDLSHSVATYWRDRALQHTGDSYVGVQMSKFPEDLRVYEHLLWASRADVVLEIGAQFGGSALWFRDRLRTMAHYGRIAGGHVFSVDVNIAAAQAEIVAADPSCSEDITLVEGDVCDPALPELVETLLPNQCRCFVVEDSAHTYETTLAALTGFGRLVPVGGYFVVEDGCVDIEEMRISEGWPRGVLAALGDWLRSSAGSRFTVRRDLERYGLSCHPGGFLQRVAPDSP